MHEGYLQSLRAALQAYQQEGELDAYLVARDEIRRFEKERSLRKEHLVGEPKDLAWLQQFFIGSSFETAHQIAEKHTALLLPLQRSLTRAGKIDEALRVRQVVAEIRNQHKEAYEWALARQKEGVPSIPAASLAGLYKRDMALADRMLRGKTYRIEGRLADFGIDMSNGRIFRIVLGDAAVGALKVEGEFSMTDYLFKTSSAGERMTATIERHNSDQFLPLSLHRGATFSFIGQIDGKHLNVKVAKAGIPEDAWKPRPKPAGAQTTKTP